MDNKKENLDKDKNEHKKNYTKYIIMLFIIVTLILLAVIFMLCRKNSPNNSNTVNENTVNEASIEKKNIAVEENNGYKTFNFTVDDIIRINSLDTSEIISNSTAPYCREHNGTNCMEFGYKLDEYVEVRGVYEEKSRKVISIDLLLGNSMSFFVASDYGVDTNDINKITAFGFEYTQKYLEDFIENLGLSYNFSQVLTNPDKTKNILSKEDPGVTGQYSIEEDNVGYIKAVTPVGLLIRIIATDEENLYNLSVNSLTNLLLSDDFELDKSSNILTENNNEETETNIETSETKDMYKEKNNNQETNTSKDNSSTKQYKNSGKDRLMVAPTSINEKLGEPGNYNVNLTIQAEGKTVKELKVNANLSTLENVLQTVNNTTSIKFDMQEHFLYNCIINGQAITELLENKGKMSYGWYVYINGESYFEDRTDVFKIQDGDEIVIDFYSIIL